MRDSRRTKEEKQTLSVSEAGRRLGIGRNAAYEAVHRGEIPSIRIGRLLKVPKIALMRMLECAGQDQP
jgi:excisionase family DNA binding protein